MFKTVARRLMQSIPVALIVTALVFFSIWLMPGDPVNAFVPPGEVLDEEQLSLLRQEHNLDRPVVVQYFIWLGDGLTGDLGRSLQTKRSVAGELMSRGQVTLALALTGSLLSIMLAIPVGVASAVWRGRWIDHVVTVISIGAVAIPGVWLGIMMILLFGVTLGWLPVQGYVPLSDDPLQWARHIILPAFAIGVTSSALVMRQTIRRVHEEHHWGKFIAQFGMLDPRLGKFWGKLPRRLLMEGLESGRFSFDEEQLPSITALGGGAVMGATSMVLSGLLTWRQSSADTAELYLRAIGVPRDEARAICTRRFEPLPRLDFTRIDLPKPVEESVPS